MEPTYSQYIGAIYFVELFVLYRIRDWKPIALDDGCCGKRDDTLSAFRPGGCGDSLYL